MTTTRIRARLHDAQKEIHRSTARFRVVCAGRRFGKTRLGVMECIGAGAEGKRAWWIAPSYSIAGIGWRAIRRMVSRVPGAVISLSTRTATFPGGGEIAVRSADNPDSLRGEGLDLVVLDECAYIKQETWGEVLRPALADKLGRALFISTPRGRNWFWDIYQRGVSGEEGWQSFSFPTASNPHIQKSEIEDARRSLPELIYRQEFLAEFIDSSGAVFRRVMEAARLEAQDAPEAGHQYIAGVDVASSIDYTVVTVLDVATKHMVYLDRFNRVDYGVLEDRLSAVCARWGLDSMTVESNSIGQPVIDALVHRGLPIFGFVTTQATKAAAIQALQSAFEHDEIAIINDPVLIGELLSYESKRSANGAFSYSAPEGMHDDCVMSLAIAYNAVNGDNWVMS